MTIRVISFDLDGTLSEEGYDRFFWHELLPQLYANRHDISFEKAKSFVLTEHSEMWEATGGEWFDINFWLYRYDLYYSAEDVLDMARDKIKHYKDTIKTLELLKEQGYTLIITTTAYKNLIREKLNVDHLDKFFDHLFSASEDFNSKHKNSDVFKNVLEKINVNPEEMIHIGDSVDNDYTNPRDVGINTILIDRDNKHLDVKNRITSLEELSEYLNKVS
ncbi:MAG: HAD family hydrolase [Nanobdellota archaeon]